MTSLLSEWEGRSSHEWARRLDVPTAEFYDEIDSTNRRGRELAEGQGPLPAVIVADRQTEGRGRWGRTWVSDTPEGLWFTVVLEDVHALRVTPLVAGLAVALGAEAEMGGTAPERLEIKWPNDVMAGGGKVAGVLCNQVGRNVVVGIGVNVNHDETSLPRGLEYPATSLRLFTGRPLSRDGLLTEVVTMLKSRMPVEDQLPESLRAELDERSFLEGRALAVKGTVRHSSGAVEAIEETPATGGRVMADGTMEVLLAEGTAAYMVAGSARLWRA